MADINQLQLINLPISTIITLGFYLVFGLFIIFTAIFYYHWKTYGTSPRVTNLTLFLYFITTLPILLIMGIMTLIIV